MLTHFAISIFVSDRNEINDDAQTESDGFYHEHLMFHPSIVSQDLENLSVKIRQQTKRRTSVTLFYSIKISIDSFRFIDNNFCHWNLIDWWT